jgi:radical SAM protein with 4Fe4S-binding SPASM domain
MDAQQFKDIYRFSSIAQLKQKVDDFLCLREQLGQQKPTLDFAFVAMQQNLTQLESVAAYAMTVGVTELFIHPVISRDLLPINFDAELDENNRLKPYFKAALYKTILTVTERYPDLHVNLSTTELEEHPLLDAIPRYFPAPLPATARIYSCDQNPWDTVHILANGDVVVCEVRDKIKLGNLHEQSLTNIWHSETYQQFRRDYMLGNIRECRDCPYKMAYLSSPPSSVIKIKNGMSTQLLRGWYPAEAEIVWSQPESLACLKKRTESQNLALKGILPPDLHGNENHLIINCNGTYLGTVYNDTHTFLSFEENFELHNIPNTILTISLKTTSVYRACEAGDSQDMRKLGFALQSMEIR